MTPALFAALLTVTPANIELKVNIAPGDSISGIRSFKVTAVSNDPITQVEFYVGEELRDSDSSLPYEFKLDTIEEADGPVQLTFTAYTTKGDSDKKKIAAKIENGLSKGADFHADKGLELVSDSKWDDAILAARIALRATPGHNRARMVMARAYLGKGALDKAQKYAEDWLASEPESLEAAELASGVSVHRAFSTLSRGSDRYEALISIREALKVAIELRQRVLNGRLEKIGPPSEANLVAYSDAAIQAGRYSLAVSALLSEARKRPDRNDLNNRLGYAQLRAGRMQDALATMINAQKLGTLDTFGLALMSVLQAIAGNQPFSDRYMREALLSDPENLSVRTSQAYLALTGNKTYALGNLAVDLEREAGQRSEANYYLFALSNAVGNFDVGRRFFEQAILSDPLSEEAYLEDANRSLGFAVNTAAQADKAFRLASAKAMFETVLLVRPESHRALIGLALTELLRGNKAQARSFAEAAVKAAPGQASAHFVQAAVFNASFMSAEASRATRLAWKLDERRLNGRSVPNGLDAWRYFITVDRVPVIAAP